MKRTDEISQRAFALAVAGRLQMAADYYEAMRGQPAINDVELLEGDAMRRTVTRRGMQNACR